MYLAMAADHQAAVGGQESFFWDNQPDAPWIISDNSDVVGVDGGCGEENKGKKVLDSSTTNSPNHEGGGGGDVAAVAVAAATKTGKKKSGGGKNGKESSGGGCGEKVDGAGESDHEIHIWTERERRKKMRNMFSNLHALLPQLPPKADKSTIVDEAVTHIKFLQQTLQKLQKQKLERLHGLSTTINFVDPSKFAQQNSPTDMSRESFLADHGSSSNLGPIVTTSPPSFSNNKIPQSPTIFQSWTSPNVTLNLCGEDAHISVCSLKKPGLFTAICYVLEKHKLEVVTAHVSSDNTKTMYMIQTRASAHEQFPEAFPIEDLYKQAAAEMMIWVNS